MILCYRSEDKRKSNDNTFGIPILNSVKTMEEEGLVVNRSLPNNREFAPFLLLDEFGPVDLAPGQVGGAPAHPPRGFETMTYMLNIKRNRKWTDLDAIYSHPSHPFVLP